MNNDFKIIINKEIINKAINIGIERYEIIAKTINVDCGYEISQHIKNIFKPVNEDLMIIGIFVYLLTKENELLDIMSINLIGGNSRIFIMPIINEILNINYELISPLWTEINTSKPPIKDIII